MTSSIQSTLELTEILDVDYSTFVNKVLLDRPGICTTEGLFDLIWKIFILFCFCLFNVLFSLSDLCWFILKQIDQWSKYICLFSFIFFFIWHCNVLLKKIFFFCQMLVCKRFCNIFSLIFVLGNDTELDEILFFKQDLCFCFYEKNSYFL